MTPRTPPSPSAATPVVVRGFATTCWKCHRPTTCVIAVHAADAQDSGQWAWFEDKHALTFARELLVQAGERRLAGTIKQRFSRTAGGSYLSNGCQHCDAIQGDWPLGHAITDYAASAPLSELPVLATAQAERSAWEAILAQRGTWRHGYRMRWDDTD